jgi:hypothetical protein
LGGTQLYDGPKVYQQFTVWINSIEPSLVGKNAVFQTWCPVIEIDPKKIISKVKLTRAVVDSETVALNKNPATSPTVEP